MTLEPAPVLALVRLKEGRTYHAHGQVWRGDRATEIRDPEFLARVRGDGLLAVTMTEAGRANRDRSEATIAAPTDHVVIEGSRRSEDPTVDHVAAESSDHVAVATSDQVAEPSDHVAVEASDHVAAGTSDQVAVNDTDTDHVAGAEAAEHGQPLADLHDEPPTVCVDATDDELDDDLADAEVNPHVIPVLEACRTPRTRGELQNITGMKHRTYFYRTCLFPLLQVGLLARTVPDKARSRSQRYVTAPAGLLVLAAKGGEQ